jgi:hypothetical protein
MARSAAPDDYDAFWIAYDRVIALLAPGKSGADVPPDAMIQAMRLAREASGGAGDAAPALQADASQNRDR